MKIDGACHCGSITYEAEADPEMTGICHCTDCQTLSGSAFRSVVPSRHGSFKLISGEPKIYVKTAESGPQSSHVSIDFREPLTLRRIKSLTDAQMRGTASRP
jgi:hypothetical protein